MSFCIFVVNISLPLAKLSTTFLALVAFYSFFSYSFSFYSYIKPFLTFFSIHKIHFVALFLDRSSFIALRVHRILASVLSTGRNFLHVFPAHIDSSSLLFVFLLLTSPSHYSLVDFSSLICSILESSYHLVWLLESSFEKKNRIQIFNSIPFFQIFSLSLFMLKIIQRRAECYSRECYSFSTGMLFSFVERSLPHCMFVRRYFACSQNSSHRSARSQTLSCKILIIVCHVSRNSCISFCFIVEASSHICGFVSDLLEYLKKIFSNLQCLVVICEINKSGQNKN